MKNIPEMNEQVEVRLEKTAKMRELGLNPYRNDLKPSMTSESFTAEKPTDQDCSLAGRVMAIRDFGKGAFVRLQDCKGLVQIFLSKDQLGAMFDNYKNFLDVGDFAWFQGKPFRTKTGELSLNASKFELLTKSIRPLPEKFHGITDVELRYRHRTLDLIMNEETRKTFKTRTKIVSTIRKFFDEMDFLEVETPMMHSSAGGAMARPFKTHHNALDMPLHMRIAPELHLKRLVAGGFDRVYEMNRQFRNEGVSIKHNPEFTSIEFYWAYATYEDLMKLTQDLYQKLALQVHGSMKINYQGIEIDFSGDWKRLSVKDAVSKYSSCKDVAKISDSTTLMRIFEEEVEAKLVQPTFITHYPTEVSPLSRSNDKDPAVVDRFELYINGWELANAFSELNDPIDQRARFEVQAALKAAGDEEACDIDEDFLYALEHGMPPTAGEGIGIDRLVMLFTNSASIRDVILFPQMRPHKP